MASAQSDLELAGIRNYKHIFQIKKPLKTEKPDRRATLKRKKNLARKSSVDKTSNRNQCGRIDANRNSTFLAFATTSWQLVRNTNIPGAVSLFTITKHLFSELPSHSEADISLKVGHRLFAYWVLSVLRNPWGVHREDGKPLILTDTESCQANAGRHQENGIVW